MTQKNQQLTRLNPATLGDFLNSKSKEMAKMAGKHFDVKRLLNMVLVAGSRNHGLYECTAASFLQFCIRCVETRTQTIGAGGAWPVPFRNKFTGRKEVIFIADYRRLGNAAIECEAITRWWADVVYSKDTFTMTRGLEPTLIHVPALANRGEPIGSYCAFKYPDGDRDFVFIPEEELQRIRKVSKAESGPWVDWPDEMRKKSAVRRAMKPLQGRYKELDTLIGADESGAGLLELDVTPIQEPRSTDSSSRRAEPGRSEPQSRSEPAQREPAAASAGPTLEIIDKIITERAVKGQAPAYRWRAVCQSGLEFFTNDGAMKERLDDQFASGFGFTPELVDDEMLKVKVIRNFK